MPPRQRSDLATGVLFALTAYGIWGLFPVYFALLKSVGPLEIVAHRIVWSLVFLLVVIAAGRRWASLLAALRSRRAFLLLVGAGVCILVNWTTYVYAVVNNFVVEASLGYFINPLVSVCLGVVVFRERLRRLQWWAVGLGVVAILVMALGTGTLPWLGLVIAASFGGYGLLKKLADIDAISSLTVETMALAPLAVVALAVWQADGTGSLGNDGPGISILLVLLGPITALPLLAFGGAATRLPLSILGLMQYLTPILQFGLGLTYFGEHMPPARWAGFILIWIALVVLTVDATRRRPGPPPREPALGEVVT